jgi:hypothetical protein
LADQERSVDCSRRSFNNQSEGLSCPALREGELLIGMQGVERKSEDYWGLIGSEELIVDTTRVKAFQYPEVGVPALPGSFDTILKKYGYGVTV